MLELCFKCCEFVACILHVSLELRPLLEACKSLLAAVVVGEARGADAVSESAERRIIDRELLRWSDAVVRQPPLCREIKEAFVVAEVIDQIGYFLTCNLYVGVDAAAVAHLSSGSCVEYGGEAVGNASDIALFVTLCIIDGLDATARRDVVF